MATYMYAYTSRIDKLFRCGGTLEYVLEEIKKMEGELDPLDIMYLKSYARKHVPEEQK